MRYRTLIITTFVMLVVYACGGGGSSPNNHPDAPAPDAFVSDCGFPGDIGNELHIGAFCASQSDCVAVQLPFCSTLGDPNTHFCTKTCTMGSTDQCGTNTTCTCNGTNQCGCTPNTCLN